MSYNIEFPDFVLDVVIPEGFEDISFRQDMCPIFYNAELGLHLLVDYKDPDAREFDDGPRFILQMENTGVLDLHTPYSTLLETDDYGEVSQHILAL